MDDPDFTAFGSILSAGAITSTISSTIFAAKSLAVGLVRNTYLKPRLVIGSEMAPISK